MLTNLLQLDEKIMESLGGVSSGGVYTSSKIQAGGEDVRIIFNNYPEDLERLFPCVLVNRKDYNIHWERMDADDEYIESVDYDQDPPVATISQKGQPYTALYDVSFLSKSISHMNDMVFSFMANIPIRGGLQITEDYTVYFNRNEVYTNITQGYKDQRFRQSLFQLKYWILIKSAITRTDILINEVTTSIEELI